MHKLCKKTRLSERAGGLAAEDKKSSQHIERERGRRSIILLRGIWFSFDKLYCSSH